MFQPELFERSKKLSRNSNVKLIDQYFDLLKLRSDGEDRILDIGSADGETTVEVILNKFPSKRETIIGIDKMDEMVEYASKKYETNPRVSFRKLDVETKEWPNDFINGYDHIFSLFTIHWISDQEATFRNLYKLLKPGGDIFLIVLVKHGGLYAFKQIKKETCKWSSYAMNVPLCILQEMDNPDQYMKEVLLKVGFDVLLCKPWSSTHVCDISEFTDMITATNSALKYIPKDNWSEHMDEYFSYIYESGLIKKENDTVYDNFTLMVLVGRKPST